MKHLVAFLILFFILGTQFVFTGGNIHRGNGALQLVPPDYLPDSTIWDYHGVVLADALSSVFQPQHIIHSEWDSANKTFVLLKHDSKVFQLNTYDEENDKSLIDYGQRGGDYLITKIIDIRNAKNPYITFLYQRTGLKNRNINTGWSDSILVGPERWVSLSKNLSATVQEPDQLLVELISADSAHQSDLLNPKESDWNVHPRHGGLPPVVGNPALSIFGGGGFRTGFYEKDKDSVLTFDDGLRVDNSDVGNDDRFERAYIFIPDTFVAKGFIRVRFRVDAEKNGIPPVITDDNDDFFLDDIKIDTTGKPDVALNSAYIQNPYSMLNLNTKYQIPVYLNITAVNTSPGKTFDVRLRIKHYDEPNWPPTPDEPGYTGTEPYSVFQTISIDTLYKIIQMPSLVLKNFRQYLKKGNNTFQVWAVISSSNADNDKSNDTLYTEFNVFLGDAIAYDDPLNPTNDYPQFSGKPGKGIDLFGFSDGYDIKDSINSVITIGSGQIAIRFELLETDTIYGYRAYWASWEQKQYDVILSIYYGYGQAPAIVDGSLINRQNGQDDLRTGVHFDEYNTYLLLKPVILPPGLYWATVSQLGTKGFNLGASGYRMGLATTIFQPFDSTNAQYWGTASYCLQLDRTLKRLPSDYSSKDPIPWYNNNFFDYENTRGSGNWYQFTPTYGNPAYAHLNHSGTVTGPYNTYSRGSFIPMLRVLMENSNYIWDNVAQSNEKSQGIEIIPNPAVNYIIISGISENENWEIFNVLGESVLKNSSNDFKSSNELRRIDVSAFPPGVYIVRAGSEVSKFVKL